MSREFYTLIFVPHAKAKFRKFQIPVRMARWVLGVGASLGVAVLAVLIHYAWISTQVHELRKLRAENVDLRSRTETYEKDSVKLQAKVQQLQGMVHKLGVMAGIEKTLPDGTAAGVGGASSFDSKPPAASLDLGSVDTEVSHLTQRSAQLEEFYRDQKLLLASTPSVWPVRGYLSTAFGNRVDPFTNQWDFHSGIDISTPIGTRILAPANGVVVWAAAKAGYGNAITINHGYGVITQYGHLDRFNVRPGQRVQRGDVIGFVGNTGRSTGPHLHYEVWVREQAQNPLHYILDESRSLG